MPFYHNVHLVLLVIAAAPLNSLAYTLRLQEPFAPHRSLNGALTCTSLTNRGTHFTAKIGVGTPAQFFDVVADTGSDSVIITSCLCMERGRCDERNKCFVGTNRSTSFSMARRINGEEGVPVVVLTFGSGQIEAVISTDVVRVGSLAAKMDEGVLLMVDQALRLSGPFEGILGLGMPRHEEQQHSEGPKLPSSRTDSPPMPGAAPAQSNSEQHGSPWAAVYGKAARLKLSPAKPLAAAWKKRIKKTNPMPPAVKFDQSRQEELALEGPAAQVGIHPQNNSTPSKDLAMPSVDSVVIGGHLKPTGRSTGEVFKQKGFLETAGVSSFSMCFNDGADGVLRLGQPKHPHALESIGQVHWGLDLRGFSVGNATAPVAFCSSSTPMKPGQTTPCGAIPDSGTTVMMGPAEHIKALFNTLCDQWERCRNEHQKVGWMKPKHEVFQLLLFGCGDWMKEEDGIKELPSVFIHLRGAEGREHQLEIPGRGYVLESYAEEAKHVTKHLMGIFPVQETVGTGVKRKVCTPAFGTQEYVTERNGPVWILGTPLFYEYQVGYDMVKPVSISFDSEPCGTCPTQTSLFSANSEITKTYQGGARARRHMPRQIHGPLHLKNWDTSVPL